MEPAGDAALADAERGTAVLKAAVARIDAHVAAAGGARGGWAPDDHAVFMSALAAYASQLGRPLASGSLAKAQTDAVTAAALDEVRAAAAAADADAVSDGNSVRLAQAAVAAVPEPFLSLDEEATLTERLAGSVMAGHPRAVLAGHVQWYVWWRQQADRKRLLLELWHELKAHAAAAKAAADAQAANDASLSSSASASAPAPGGMGAAAKPVDAETRAAIAAWRARKDTGAAAAAARVAVEAHERERAAAAERQARSEAARAELEAWRAARATATAAAAAAGAQGAAPPAAPEHRGGPPSGSNSASRTRDPAAAAALVRARADEAVAKAAAHRDAMQQAAAAAIAAKERRFGPADGALRNRATSEAGNGVWYRVVRAAPGAGAGSGGKDGEEDDGFFVAVDVPLEVVEPDRPTSASVRRATTAAEIAAREQERVAASAHAAPRASQIPRARGKSFTFGSAGVLPMRAVPAWRKAAGLR
jgi:hypothetical protein